jgi:uncharacterized protein
VLIGILSDTHGCVAITRNAVSQLLARGASHLIHCGDIDTEPILDELVGHSASFVFGNNDFDRPAMRRYGESIGLTCLGSYGVIELAGKKIAVTHGDDHRLLSRLTSRANEPGYDYLFTGHTHVRHDNHLPNGIRWINPGALYRAPIKTVALLDVSSDRLESITISE